MTNLIDKAALRVAVERIETCCRHGIINGARGDDLHQLLTAANLFLSEPFEAMVGAAERLSRDEEAFVKARWGNNEDQVSRTRGKLIRTNGDVLRAALNLGRALSEKAP